MSNTYRKDRNDKIFKEGLKKKCGRTRCRCEYCMDVEQVKLSEKIAEKEMKEEVRVIETEENIDFWDEQEQYCNDYCCTVKDNKIVEKYVINYE